MYFIRGWYMYLIQGLIGTYVFDIRLVFDYSIQVMVHVLDTRHVTCIRYKAWYIHVFNTSYGTCIQYKVWYMYLIQGMEHVFNTRHGKIAFDTRHGTCI